MKIQKMRNLIEEAGIFTEEASTGQLTGPATVHALVAIAKALTVIAMVMVDKRERTKFIEEMQEQAEFAEEIEEAQKLARPY